MSKRFNHLGALALASVIGSTPLRSDHFVRYLRRPSQPFGGVCGVDFFFSPDDPAGGGGGGNDDDPPARRRDPIVTAAKYNNDVNAMARHIDELESDNAKFRQQRNDARAQLDETKKRIAPDGTVALSAEDAKAWEEFKALGKPDDVKAAIKERDELKPKLATAEAQNAEIKRSQELRDVADAAGFKFSVLADRDKNTPGLSYEIKEEQVDGDKGQKVTVKKAYVKFKDGEGDNAPIKEQSLTEYAESQWTDFLPSLRVDATNNAAGTQTATTQNGTRVVAQGATAAGKTGTIYDKLRKQAEDKKAAQSADGKPLEERLGMAKR